MRTTHNITLNNGENLTFMLTHKHIRNINMRWDINKGLRISAPYHTPLSTVHSFILSKQDWLHKILHKKNTGNNLNYLPIRLENNSAIILGGIPHYIEIIEGGLQGIFMHDNKISIHHRTPWEQDILYDFFLKWLQKYTLFTFKQLLELLLVRLQAFQIPTPTLKIRKMRSCWGVCRLKPPSITINGLLIHTPLECLEFIMAHELAHLKHFNHSKDFYLLLEQLCPDWKVQEELLRTKYSDVLKT